MVRSVKVFLSSFLELEQLEIFTCLSADESHQSKKKEIKN